MFYEHSDPAFGYVGNPLDHSVEYGTDVLYSCRRDGVNDAADGFEYPYV